MYTDSIIMIPPKQYWESTFEAAARHPDVWRQKAINLEKAANLVLNQMKIDENASRVEGGWVHSVYKYLAGMTIENLLKGIIVADYSDTLIINGKMKPEFARHRTWTKHNKGKLRFLQNLITEDQRTLMTYLEPYVVWMGRYPVALDADQYADDLDKQLQVQLSSEKLESDFKDLYAVLFKELSNRVNAYLQRNIYPPIAPM
ncbi:MAG: hypothetical protein ACXVI0_09470 [Halobacteriota archaeon]